MSEQEQRVLDYLIERYKETRTKFYTAKRISPCTKDYVHGRWTELREIIYGLYGDYGREKVKEIDGTN